jgi:mRNA-degrading endonuclease RelE of RelBE toxin-antitoxin system
MRTRVEVSTPVEDFLRTLAPQPRRALVQAMKGLAQNRGDRKALEGKLAGYHRLRLAGYRVLYRELMLEGERGFLCDFAERRSVVYDIFQQMLLEALSKQV